MLGTGWLAAFAVLLAQCGSAHAQAEERGRVVVVTTDGLRWQEVFRGADPALMNKEAGGVADVEALRERFWREEVEERRAALLPFIWEAIARDGQLLGNADKGSVAKVANGKNFSYPGYNEMLTGAPDPAVDSNAKRPNPNVNVLEWLEKRPGFEGEVAAFCSWDVFPYILNRDRGGVAVNAGWEPIRADKPTPEQALLDRLIERDARVWESCRHDALTFEAAMLHLETATPRVLYIGLGDTDEYAHEGRYAHYLHAAHAFDADLRRLWEYLQSSPEYRGRTTLLLTTDHGRGDAPTGWKSHGEKIAGSESIWFAAIGPRVAPLGERSNTPALTQGQTAATIAAFLGEDFTTSRVGIAPPIAEFLAAPEQSRPR
jgi:hypothetical protein